VVVHLTRGRVHYAWIVFGVTFFTLLAAAGIRSTPGVLIVPLEHEFGWTRAEISLAVGINLLLFGLCGPFAAALMARFGVRRVLLIALLLIASGVGLTSVMRAPWQLDLLWGVLVGAGTGSMAGVLAATVANRWFVARRGLVTGVLTAATATGQLVFLPLLASLAVNQGWRWASLTVALSALVAIPVVALLMRDDPARIGLKPYGATEEYKAPSVLGNPFAAAVGGLTRGVRSLDFWLLASSFFICGASTNGLIGTHLIPASVDHGIAEVTAASMLALIGLFDVIGTTASGWLTDRLDSRWLLFWYYGLRGLSLLFLPFALSSSYLVLLLFIVFYGLDWVATVPPTIALCTRIFGPAQAAIVFGWVFAAHQFGSAFAAFTAGALRTWLGDYQVTFITAGLLCLIASGLVIRIGRASAGESPARPLAPEAA
jgi:MFS family permease